MSNSTCKWALQLGNKTYRSFPVLSLPIVFLVLLSGCTPVSPQKPKYEYELITVEEQALEEIQNIPTTFVLSKVANSAAWTRARIFLESYVGGAIYKSQDLLTSKEDIRFSYSVRRADQKSGISYEVQCKPKDKSEIDSAKLNAKNLAHFIRDGKLELSLLHR